MKDREKLIKNYLEKFINSYNKYFAPTTLSNSTIKEVRNYIYSLVNKGIDYLLTDSLIDYMCYEGIILKSLKKLNSGNYQLIAFLVEYISKIDVALSFKEKGEEAHTYLIDKDFEEALSTISNSVYKTIMNFQNNRYYDVRYLIYITFAYYLINNREDNIYDMCNIFLNEPDRILDSIKINNVFKDEATNSEDEERLIDFVFSKLGSRSNREIR